MQSLAESWVDLLSVGLGVAYLAALYFSGKLTHPFISVDTATVFVEGLSLAPLVLLAPAAFSPAILEAIVASSRLTLFSAAAFALFAIIGPRWNPPPP